MSTQSRNPGWNLARFDLLSIRLALSCAHSGSLTAAARESHIALAAASRRLRELELSLGGALFERSARGLALTAAGHVFVKHASALLGQVDRMGAELSDLTQGIARHVRLVASTAAINQFLPPLLARWAELQPQVRIDLEEQVSEAVVAALHERRADIGIFVEGPDTRGLATRLFRHDELAVLLPPQHRLARGRSALRFADLLHEDWIGLNTGAAVLLRQQQAANAAGLPLRLRVQVRSFDAVCHMVASGLGLALLPRAAVEPFARVMRLATRPLADAWAQRRLLLGVPELQADEQIESVAAFLAAVAVSSPNAKTHSRKRQ